MGKQVFNGGVGRHARTLLDNLPANHACRSDHVCRRGEATLCAVLEDMFTLRRGRCCSSCTTVKDCRGIRFVALLRKAPVNASMYTATCGLEVPQTSTLTFSSGWPPHHQFLPGRFIAYLLQCQAESPSPRYLPRVLAGITEFNHLTPGSQLYQITAAPGTGKTAIFLHFAKLAAAFLTCGAVFNDHILQSTIVLCRSFL